MNCCSISSMKFQWVLRISWIFYINFMYKYQSNLLYFSLSQNLCMLTQGCPRGGQEESCRERKVHQQANLMYTFSGNNPDCSVISLFEERTRYEVSM